jgi:hypothetical protein
LKTQGNQEKPVSRWPVAGPSGCWLLASSLASKVRTAIHTYYNTHKMTTIHARQIQFTNMHIRKTTPSEESTVYIVSNAFLTILHIRFFLPQTFASHHCTTHIYPSHYTPLSPLPYTALHYTSLHFTSLHYTFLHF